MGDTYTMIGWGLVCLVAVWLVFSILKKIAGLIFLAALAVGAYALWTNPTLLHGLVDAVQRGAG